MQRVALHQTKNDADWQEDSEIDHEHAQLPDHDSDRRCQDHQRNEKRFDGSGPDQATNGNYEANDGQSSDNPKIPAPKPAEEGEGEGADDTELAQLSICGVPVDFCKFHHSLDRQSS